MGPTVILTEPTLTQLLQDVQIEGEEGDMGEDNLRARLGLGATWKKIPNSKWLLKLIGEKQKETLLQVM